VFENKALRKMLGPKREEWRKAGEKFVMKSFMACTLDQILLG
jgi:hypothetical protein